MPPAAGMPLAVGLEDLLPFAFVLVWLVVQGINLFRRAGGQAGPLAGPPRPRPGDERMVEMEELLRRSLGLEKPPEPPPRPRAAKRAKRAAATAGAAPTRGDAGGSDVARHVQEAFAHDLVHQSPDAIPLPPVAATSPVVAELVAALRSPAGIRQMVILKEVFDRPSERW